MAKTKTDDEVKTADLERKVAELEAALKAKGEVEAFNTKLAEWGRQVLEDLRVARKATVEENPNLARRLDGHWRDGKQLFGE